MWRQPGPGKAKRDIWVRDLARGVMTRLTFDPAADGLPVWSPDGKQIAFSSDREGGVFQIYRKDASGAGQEERLTEGASPKLVLDWSKDGKYILYQATNPGTGNDLMALPLEGDRKPIPVVSTKFNELTGAISPDGRWLAYASDDSGQFEIYVQAFPCAAGGPARRSAGNTSYSVLRRFSNSHPAQFRRHTRRPAFPSDPQFAVGKFRGTSDGGFQLAGRAAEVAASL